MKTLQIFLLFAFVISMIMTADLKIRNIKGGSSRSRGSSSSSSSRGSGTSSGRSNLGYSNINLGNHASSFSGAQHSQSQGIQTHPQASDLFQKNEHGQINGAPKPKSGLPLAGSAAVASNSMMFHSHRSNSGNTNKTARGGSSTSTSTTTAPRSL